MFREHVEVMSNLLGIIVFMFPNDYVLMCWAYVRLKLVSMLESLVFILELWPRAWIPLSFEYMIHC